MTEETNQKLDYIMWHIHKIFEIVSMEKQALHMSLLIKDLEFASRTSTREEMDQIRHSMYQYLRNPKKIGEHYDNVV